MPDQVTQNSGDGATGILGIRRQALKLHLRNLLHVGLKLRTLERPGDQDWDHDFRIVVGQRRLQVTADAGGSAQLLAELLGQDSSSPKIERLVDQVSRARHPEIADVEQRLQIAGLGNAVLDDNVASHAQNVGDALALLVQLAGEAGNRAQLLSEVGARVFHVIKIQGQVAVQSAHDAVGVQ